MLDDENVKLECPSLFSEIIWQKIIDREPGFSNHFLVLTENGKYHIVVRFVLDDGSVRMHPTLTLDYTSYDLALTQAYAALGLKDQIDEDKLSAIRGKLKGEDDL